MYYFNLLFKFSFDIIHVHVYMYNVLVVQVLYNCVSFIIIGGA